MLFSSNIFIFLFLPIVLFFYYIIFRNFRMFQNIILLISSLFFYAWGEPKFVLVMIISIIFNYCIALLVEYYKNNTVLARFLLIFMLICNLSVLFLFKYLDFSISIINSLFKIDVQFYNIKLPIGISFFTFQAISYVIDVYRGNGQVQKNPMYVALYISFFAQLIAGPIVRYQSIANQLINRKEDINTFTDGIYRFILGLSKKVLIANSLAIVADKAFELLELGELSTSFAWLGAISYTFQIYYDFSGYSDMAVGLGKMFGFHFEENFNFPYVSKSISEFWRRWHISLGSWFRDYVYFPLGGSKVSKNRLILNLFIVWLLTGIWHGASWNFVLWGLIYYVFICFEKLTGIPSNSNNIVKRFYRILTLIIIILGWVIFRAESLNDAVNYLAHMIGYNNSLYFDDMTVLYLSEYAFELLAAALFSVDIFGNIQFQREYKIEKFSILDFVRNLGLIILFVASISYMLKGSYNPFLYFNF